MNYSVKIMFMNRVILFGLQLLFTFIFINKELYFDIKPFIAELGYILITWNWEVRRATWSGLVSWVGLTDQLTWSWEVRRLNWPASPAVVTCPAWSSSSNFASRPARSRDRVSSLTSLSCLLWDSLATCISWVNNIIDNYNLQGCSHLVNSNYSLIL